MFEKEVKEDIGDFAVDILLDSSGSQMERQSRVASQGYVISQALSLVNIPNRVLSFNNFLDFTIIRRFRDYNDPIIKNKNIFYQKRPFINYFCFYSPSNNFLIAKMYATSIKKDKLD